MYHTVPRPPPGAASEFARLLRVLHLEARRRLALPRAREVRVLRVVAAVVEAEAPRAQPTEPLQRVLLKGPDTTDTYRCIAI